MALVPTSPSMLNSNPLDLSLIPKLQNESQSSMATQQQQQQGTDIDWAARRYQSRLASMAKAREALAEKRRQNQQNSMLNFTPVAFNPPQPQPQQTQQQTQQDPYAKLPELKKKRGATSPKQKKAPVQKKVKTDPVVSEVVKKVFDDVVGDTNLKTTPIDGFASKMVKSLGTITLGVLTYAALSSARQLLHAHYGGMEGRGHSSLPSTSATPSVATNPHLFRGQSIYAKR